MIPTQQLTRMCRARVGKVSIALALTVSLVACDSLLNVDLPGSVTEDATFVPSQAALIVNSAIADTECALSAFTAFEGAGYEDSTTRTVGWWGSRFERPTTPNTSGNCAGSEENTTGAWFAQLQKARWMSEQVYDRLANEWDASQVADHDKLMAEADIYAGIAYTHFGEFFCEVTADGGPMMTWSESLQKAEGLFTDAINIIGTTGDFSIPTDVTTSAEQMAHLLRARARFAQNTSATDALAAQDAALVTQGFESMVTRDAGAERSRWNRPYSAFVGLGWAVLLGPVDWWSGDSGANDLMDPWPQSPDTIPYTGYWDLAVMPDGRAISDAGIPITLADAGSVADPRVPAIQTASSGLSSNPNSYEVWEEQKYKSQGDDIPLAKWEEAWLIQAQVANENGDPATAIGLVNDIRTADGVPTITYLDGTSTQAEVQNMLLEEIRRTHFMEPGRWWSTKLRYHLWFPRNQGVDQWNFGYQNGVRMVFPNGEYTTNKNLTPDDQGSGCRTTGLADQDPTI